VYVRSKGPRLLFGAARPDQPDGYDVSVDWPRMESMLELASARFGWLAGLPLDRSGCWAGTYENTPGVCAARAPVIPAQGDNTRTPDRPVMHAPDKDRRVSRRRT